MSANDLSAAARNSIAALNGQVAVLNEEIERLEQTRANVFAALDMLDGAPVEAAPPENDGAVSEVEMWLREHADRLSKYNGGFNRTDLIRDFEFKLVPEKELFTVLKDMEEQGVLTLVRKGKGQARYYAVTQ